MSKQKKTYKHLNVNNENERKIYLYIPKVMFTVLISTDY